MQITDKIIVPRKTWSLPKTGQTTSRRTGDNGTYQMGQNAPAYASRFVNNTDGTVSDRHTGLMWVRQPELIIPGAAGIHASNQIQAARGNWATGTVYSLADVAYDAVALKYYFCAVAH